MNELNFIVDTTLANGFSFSYYTNNIILPVLANQSPEAKELLIYEATTMYYEYKRLVDEVKARGERPKSAALKNLAGQYARKLTAEKYSVEAYNAIHTVSTPSDVLKARSPRGRKPKATPVTPAPEAPSPQVAVAEPPVAETPAPAADLNPDLLGELDSSLPDDLLSEIEEDDIGELPELDSPQKRNVALSDLGLSIPDLDDI